MFEEFTDRIDSFPELSKLEKEEVQEMKRMFPNFPVEYFAFIEEFGYGNFGEFQLYSGPVNPDSIYGNGKNPILDKILLIGDDFQGYCFGFDTTLPVVVFEINDCGTEIDKLSDTFIKFLRDAF